MDLYIEKLIPGGQALTTLPDGRKAFLWNALPGEIVEDFETTNKKSHYTEGIATKIKKPSAHRISPIDSCYLSTSPWQIMDYDYELEQKRELLLEQFRQFNINLSPELPVTDGNLLNYRNKMEYALYWDNKKERIFLAFRYRGTHKKMPITFSSLERPEILTAAKKIVSELNRSHSEARKYQSLLLRCNQTGEVSGGLLENRKPHPTFKNLTDKILGKPYSYSPNGFFQINLPVYELALKEIKKHIKTDKVLDLYSGVGTIGLSVAEGKNLILVECNKSAFGELEKNCQGNAKPILANSENCLDYISPDTSVILDPPRAGCDKKLLDRLLEILPPVVIYLSCNPATQARDVKILLEKYHITSQTSFNFFPRTPHLENLIILER